jgi:hypothetical protein
MNNDREYRSFTFRLFFAACGMGLLISLVARPLHAQYVHQLSYNGSHWTDQNLGGAAVETNGTGIAAFDTTPNDQTHVYYSSPTGYAIDDVHQLFFNGFNWADQDLTLLTSAPANFSWYSQKSGFSVGNYQYVYYITGGEVHQMLYDNSGWTDTNLTNLAGVTDYADDGGLLAFTTTPALHVYFVAHYGVIHQLFSPDGVTWQDVDLTYVANTYSCACWMSGFNIGNLQYLYVLDVVGHIHQLFYNNSTWSDQDLTALTKTPPASFNSGVEAVVIPGTNKIRLYFTAVHGGHLMQLASNTSGKWSSTDLTKKSKGPIPNQSNQILAFTSNPNNEVNVYYVSGNDVNRLSQPTPTTWSNEDLTALTDGGLATPTNGLAGFSVNNNQYVFYVAQ